MGILTAADSFLLKTIKTCGLFEKRYDPISFDFHRLEKLKVKGSCHVVFAVDACGKLLSSKTGLY